MRIELDDCLAADRRRLKSLLRDLKSQQGDRKDKARADFDALAKRSSEAVTARRARLPKPEYDEDLPVNTRRAEIAALIAKHQVVIVCGETGSGKTTQLPKICLELGRGAPA
jgi:ATP-dependent helicase HrpA